MSGGDFTDLQLLGNFIDAGGLLWVAEKESPSLGGRVGKSSEFVELVVLLEGFLFLGERSELPLLLIHVTVHNDTLGASDDSVIAGGNGGGGHLGDGEGNGLTLGGDQDDLAANLDATLVSEDTGKHELGSVAHRVDGGVLDDDPGVGGQEDLERHDDSAEVVLVVGVLEVPLGIKDVVHGDHGLVLLEGTGADTSEFLHVGAASEEVTEMDAESTDVGTGLTGDPDNSEVSLLIVLDELQVIDSPDTELLLDSGDQWWPLEAGTGELLKSSLDLLDLVDALMQLEHSNVFFTSRLLSLDQSGGILDADDEAASDLGIEGTTVTGLLDLQDLLDPGDDLMGGGVGWLVEVDDTVVLEDVDGSLSGRVAAGEGGEVVGLHIEFVEVLLPTEIKIKVNVG